jgi:hypothetical protein
MNTVLISLLSMVMVCSSALAMPIEFVDSYVVPGTQTIQWSIQFSAAPDFMTVDEFGRQDDSFQIQTVEAVIRGEELHYGNGLPIRSMPSSLSRSADLMSGGWGDVRDVAFPVLLDGLRLVFDTKTLALGVEPTQPFKFEFMALHYGDSTNAGANEPVVYCTSGERCTPLPLPETFVLFAVGLLGIGAMKFFMKHGAMVDKLAYNRSRLDHTHAARTAPGGKAY